MATLLLTAVGTAIGGPIGGAIGGLLGQAVDSRVFAPKGRQGPRLTELQVQTSSYGTQIPQIFGKMRVAGCVIWATDLHESSARGGGGKGQPSVTNYSYSVSFAVALSNRPVAGVGRIWADGKLLRGAAGDFKSATGFRLHGGDEDQPADPLIAAAEGAGLAPAHRGIAYAVFENFQLADYGNRIPSLTFEVIADAAPVAIGSIAAAIGAGALTGAGRGVPLDGFSAYGDSVRGVVEVLTGASGAWFAATPGGLALAMPDDETAGTVAYVGVGGQRANRRITPVETCAKTLAVAYYDPARDYQTGVQQISRPGAGWRSERIDLPACLSADAAKAMTVAGIADREAARTTRTIGVGLEAIAVTPGAIVTIAGEAGRWRVTKAECEGFAVSLTLVALASPQVAVLTGSSGRAAVAADLAVGETLIELIETPALDDALLTRPRITICASGTAPGWRRAVLQYSLDDGASWEAIGASALPAVIGRLATTLPTSAATLVDRANRIDVAFAHDGFVLAGADPARVDGGANLAVIGDELIQFERATRIAPGRWRLEGLWRGRRATVSPTHAAGTRFVLLETASATTLSVAAAPGQTIRVIASGVGDAVPVEASRMIDGASILPPAPTHLIAQRDGTGAVTAQWVRRARVNGRWIDGAEVPLCEDFERYRIDLTDAAGTRTLTSEAPEIAVPTTAGDAVLTVRQLGTCGASSPISITL